MAQDDTDRDNGSILEMARGRDGRYEGDLMAFRAYWHSMRRGADVPLRSEIDPRGIESLLSRAFIAEKIAPGLARLRIAGLHLSDLMGMEVRGMPLSSMIDVADRARLSNALVELFERPAAIRLDLASPGSIRRAPMKGTMLILPLRSDLGDISRALGCFVTTGAIGAAPRRFRITACEITPIDITATVVPEPERATGLAEAHAPFEHKPDSGLSAERPYLRLVRG